MVKHSPFKGRTARSVLARGTKFFIMSRTVRKSVDGIKYPDGKPNEKVVLNCHCWFCMKSKGKEKRNQLDKIALKQMNLDINDYRDIA